MKGLMPIKIEGCKLSANEQSCLAWMVLSGCKPSEAFKTFLHPEILSSATLDRLAKQFVDSVDAIGFVTRYTQLIKDKLDPPDVKPEQKKKSSEERRLEKEQALARLTDYVVDQALNFADAENKDEILKYADKLGLLDSEEEHIEAPRRYLPEMCDTCEYKKWIDSNTIIKK